MRFAFILVEKAHYPIAVLCRVMQVSRSGFHAWRKRPPSRRDVLDRKLLIEITVSFERSRKAYGSPRVHRDLQADGHAVSRKRVARLMKTGGIVARARRRFKATTDSRHDHPIAPNVINRRFEASHVNRAWVTDVKAIHTREGWLYFAPVLDLCSRRVVGMAFRDSNDTDLALDALNSAISRRVPVPGLIHHSDRGSPYASERYRARLASIDSVASMSRKGDCWDNAVAESFFSTVAHELLSGVSFDTMAEAEAAIREYVTDFYNLYRRHSTLGYVSPIEFELQSHTAALAA